MASPIKGNWQRKEFNLGDENCQIKIKLWDSMVDLIEPGYVGQTVLVKNLMLDRYGGRNTLASTPETEITIIYF